MKERESRVGGLRLAAEFAVIVIGVLVALGVDSWAADRRDRALESEYLDRLLEDVRYDLDELAFVASTSRLGAEAAQILNTPGVADTMPANEVVAALFVLTAVRVPDLSRSTFDELINSGQIELIQAQEVRRALASYDRTNNELASAWNTFDPDLWRWVSSRIPSSIYGRFQAECSVPATEGVNMLSTICPFDMGGWSARSLRADLGSVDAEQRLRRSEYNYGAHVFFASLLTEEARRLEAALVSVIQDR